MAIRYHIEKTPGFVKIHDRINGRCIVSAHTDKTNITDLIRGKSPTEVRELFGVPAPKTSRRGFRR